MVRYRTVNVECQRIVAETLPMGNSGTLVHSVPDFASVRYRNRLRRPVFCATVHLLRKHASPLANVAAVEHWRSAEDDFDHLDNVAGKTVRVAHEIFLQLFQLHLIRKLHLDSDRRRLLARGALDSSFELK